MVHSSVFCLRLLIYSPQLHISYHGMTEFNIIILEYLCTVLTNTLYSKPRISRYMPYQEIIFLSLEWGTYRPFLRSGTIPAPQSRYLTSKQISETWVLSQIMTPGIHKLITLNFHEISVSTTRKILEIWITRRKKAASKTRPYYT